MYLTFLSFLHLLKVCPQHFLQLLAAGENGLAGLDAFFNTTYQINASQKGRFHFKVSSLREGFRLLSSLKQMQ